MRICIVVDDYLPESMKVAAKMMHELAVGLKSVGHEVTVITPGIGVSFSFKVDEFDGLKVLRFYSGPIKNISKVRRLINEILLSWRSWKTLKGYLVSNPHDFIIYYSPSIFWFGLIRKLKQIWNAPAYLILRDLFPQWVVDAGLIKENGIITAFLRYCEKKNYKVADRIGVQSPANERWFLEKHGEFKNVQVLYNWASSLRFQNSQIQFREKLKLQNKIVFFYGGNLGQAQDMMAILRLAKRMSSHNEAHFLLVGAGDEFELVERKIATENISNVTLMSAVPQEEYKKMLSEFDIGLFTLNGKHRTHNFPGKILEYMAQGKPILGSINPGNDLQEVIQSGKAGFVSVSGEDDLFYRNALQLLDKNIREKCGKNSEILLRSKFSVDSAISAILRTSENQLN
ncbi:glycosyltransferase WbuB [Leptospira yasudae]|uniref:glycosyltransferase family 4 protein n=1 Tax=Leptospira yasudae TaxID=2202201 RepID=UPI000E59A8D8|nr:glycosyltransferase family 4 protein [Leptospira yasudae]RHX91213.1 glycosyltransferase WbuB [Leptospira yasudae]